MGRPSRALTPEVRIANARHLARAQARRADRQARGFCGTCGVEPFEPGHWSCQWCRAARGEQRWRRMFRGICERCPAAIPIGTRKCARCLVAMRVYWREHHARWGTRREVTVSDLMWRRITGERRS